jgi:hypothetical protein
MLVRTHVVALLAALLFVGVATSEAAGAPMPPLLLEESSLVGSSAPSLWLGAGLASVRPTLPPESFSLGGKTRNPNGRRLGVVVGHFKLKYEKHLLIRIKCQGCAKRERVSHGVVGSHALKGQFIPNRATLIVRVTSSHEIGRYLEILDAGTESGYLREPQLCLQSKATKPEECEEEKSAKAECAELLMGVAHQWARGRTELPGRPVGRTGAMRLESVLTRFARISTAGPPNPKPPKPESRSQDPASIPLPLYFPGK